MTQFSKDPPVPLWMLQNHCAEAHPAFPKGDAGLELTSWDHPGEAFGVSFGGSFGASPGAREGSFEQREGVLRANSKSVQKFSFDIAFCKVFGDLLESTETADESRGFTKMSQRWARHSDFGASTKELEGLWRRLVGSLLSSERASHETPKLHFRTCTL